VPHSENRQNCHNFQVISKTVTVGAKWMSAWYRVSQISGWAQDVPKKWKTIFSFREISQKLCEKQKWSKLSKSL